MKKLTTDDFANIFLTLVTFGSIIFIIYFTYLRKNEYDGIITGKILAYDNPSKSLITYWSTPNFVLGFGVDTIHNPKDEDFRVAILKESGFLDLSENRIQEITRSLLTDDRGWSSWI